MGDSTEDRGPSHKRRKETPMCCLCGGDSTDDMGYGVGGGMRPPVLCCYGGDSIDDRLPDLGSQEQWGHQRELK